MREMLINLLSTAGWDLFKHDCDKQQIADHLIKSGVTIPVRCKDCVFAEPCDASDSYVECHQFFGMAMDNDWYCADGERRNDE